MKKNGVHSSSPGDFTTHPRVLMLILMAAFIGAVATGSAWVLLKLINLASNLAFFGRVSAQMHPITDNMLGALIIFIPVLGGLIIGLMARYGSDKIRGHGIPEALEAILIGESRMSPTVAILKPISSAISIGTGGPFGAEGPIIMTGGALGSLFAQLFHMTSSERKTLLVAGASAGMTAIFGTPMAAILLAIELLLFEWKPRSFIPVVAGAVTAAAFRPLLFSTGPLFPFAASYAFTPPVLAGSLAVGLLGGLCASLLTYLVYGFEDLFEKLPVHWMWWPALGGIAVGIGGWLDPAALGVGYDNIRGLLDHSMTQADVGRLLIVKTLIWAIALGSGTSGGVLAPLLIIGGSLGFLVGHYMPGDSSYWAMLCMAATMGGTMRAPLTATLFAVELTGNDHALLPLMVACTAAYAFTVLVLKRSILTEKLARRGHHISREYSIDPFAITHVKEVMVSKVDTLGGSMKLGEAIAFFASPDQRRYKSYPVTDEQAKVLGMVSRGDILRWIRETADQASPLSDLVAAQQLVAAFPDELVADLTDRMVEKGLSRVPVVDRVTQRLAGLVSRKDLLSIRSRILSEEQDRKAFFRR